ncbi:TonB-dependent receptor [Psychrosphaera sp. 1_MG-2023]|uniref:TonB-dependent receptor plug domain-containing protein n=1 Tax=Psychrosphaera sp. 1_MG-2023 TaxID=3062643 RepID=UPI0026E15BB6|nr:TonB-dependent receptor [Psychrosphaera sp. 1_MG-2023]MDO6720750.1 TonB-dependent receptor [Psychrosphaera sp. 1_MG-2023]
MRNITAILLVVTSCSGYSAQATGAEKGKPNDIETIEVFANFNPVRSNQMPSSTFVLEKHQIDKMQGTSALDLLAQVPGITTKSSGMVQEIFLRGAETNFVILQIDGVQVNNPMDSRGGSFDLNSVSKNIIQRIEIIKGAQSSIYGSDAIAGVINLITFEPSNDVRTVGLHYSKHGKKIATIAVGGQNSALSANYTTTDVQPNGNKLRAAEFSIHHQVNLLDDSTTRFNIRHSRYRQQGYADQSGGAMYAANTDKENKDGKSITAAVRHTQKVSPEYQLGVQAEYYLAEDNITSPGIQPYDNAPPSQSQNEYEYIKVRWLNQLLLGSNTLTAGIDIKSEQGKTDGQMLLFGTELPTIYDITRDNFAAFIDSHWKIARASLFASFRHDYSNEFKSINTWKLGADYNWSPNIRGYINVGTAFKQPSLYALSNNLIGNMDLEPEEAFNTDLGLEWFVNSSSLSASIFSYEYENLIDFDGQTFALVNRSNIRSAGAEVIVEHELTTQLSMSGHVTYVHTKTQEGALLTGRPEWQAGLTMNYQYNKNLSTSISTTYISDTTATSLHTGTFSVEQLSAYSPFHAALFWQLNDKHLLDFYLTNIFDEQYQTAVGVPGERQTWGVKYQYVF